VLDETLFMPRATLPEGLEKRILDTETSILAAIEEHAARNRS